MDWTLIRSFLAVVEEGSLSAAARTLKKSQPTLGRHIQQLEEQLSTRLFDRRGDGFVLTPSGTDLVDSARAMSDAATDLERIAQGRAETVGGTVRISCNEVLGVETLPGIIADLIDEHPEFQIELVVTNEVSNLLKREADVAIRMMVPSQGDLIARKIKDIPVSFYAHREYLSKHGAPQTIAELFTHRLIGYDRSTVFIDGAKAMGFTVTPDQFVFRSDSILAQHKAVEEGLGIAPYHRNLAARNPDLVEVIPDFPLPPLGVWLTCHQDVRHNRAIRTVMDFLAERLVK